MITKFYYEHLKYSALYEVVNKTQLKNNKHHSIKLQRAWDKYGEENFEFKIEEIVDSLENLLNLESRD